MLDHRGSPPVRPVWLLDETPAAATAARSTTAAGTARARTGAGAGAGARTGARARTGAGNTATAAPGGKAATAARGTGHHDGRADDDLPDERIARIVTDLFADGQTGRENGRYRLLLRAAKRDTGLVEEGRRCCPVDLLMCAAGRKCDRKRDGAGGIS
jgi:hypothetical protein